MQFDGNFVVYINYWGKYKPIWATQTFNKSKGPYVMRVQVDNNLVIYDGNSKPLWASHNTGKEPRGLGAKLTMQNNGNLVFYDDIGAPIWNTNSFK